MYYKIYQLSDSLINGHFTVYLKSVQSALMWLQKHNFQTTYLEDNNIYNLCENIFKLIKLNPKQKTYIRWDCLQHNDDFFIYTYRQLAKFSDQGHMTLLINIHKMIQQRKEMLPWQPVS